MPDTPALLVVSASNAVLVRTGVFRVEAILPEGSDLWRATIAPDAPDAAPLLVLDAPFHRANLVSTDGDSWEIRLAADGGTRCHVSGRAGDDRLVLFLMTADAETVRCASLIIVPTGGAAMDRDEDGWRVARSDGGWTIRAIRGEAIREDGGIFVRGGDPKVRRDDDSPLSQGVMGATIEIAAGR